MLDKSHQRATVPGGRSVNVVVEGMEMDNQKSGDGVVPKDAGRRDLLKAATVAGGAVAASVLLPGSWKKPIATMGGLPAHAQTSQTINLGNARAYYYPSSPDMARGASMMYIEAQCEYDDTLGDFGADNHWVTYKVTPGDATDVTATGSNPSDCGQSFTHRIDSLDHSISATSPAPTTHRGKLIFFVYSACLPPGWITWKIYRDGHVSNSVTAQLLKPPF